MDRATGSLREIIDLNREIMKKIGYKQGYVRKTKKQHRGTEPAGVCPLCDKNAYIATNQWINPFSREGHFGCSRCLVVWKIRYVFSEGWSKTKPVNTGILPHPRTFDATICPYCFDRDERWTEATVRNSKWLSAVSFIRYLFCPDPDCKHEWTISSRPCKTPRSLTGRRFSREIPPLKSPRN
jgi:hypothetical protein